MGNAPSLDPDVAKLSFVPLKPTRPVLPRPPVDLSRFPTAQRLLRMLEPQLASLARRLRRQGPLDGGAIVLLTGARPGVGCTTLALAFAAAATTERSVLLLDGAGATGGLSDAFTHRMGWQQAVQDGRPLRDLITYPDPDHRVAVLPQLPNDVITTPLSPSSMASWLAEVRQDFDLIIIDGATVDSHGRRWAALADATILICGADPNDSRQWASAWDRLEEAGGAVLGIIENFIED